MKKVIVLCSLLCVMCAGLHAFGAANVLVPKKAAAVAQREASSSTTDLGASLLPTAVGLVMNVVQLQQQQKQLRAECEPTNKELDFVNKMVKEWAIAGAANPLSKRVAGGGIGACAGGKDTYKNNILQLGSSVSVDSSTLCYDVYTASDARGAVWVGFPKAVVVKYCPDGTEYGCAESKKKVASNMWDVFAMITFDERDYTKSEASQARALLDKAANCSSSKLTAKKMEALGGFVTNTISNMGQTTNTGSVMDAVSGVIGASGGGLGSLGSLATVATQFLDR